MMRFGLLLVVACAGSACGSTSDRVLVTAAQIDTEPTAALCDAVTRAGSDKEALLQEMLRRNAISSGHAADIRAGKVVAGMNSCETIASWGPPVRYSSTPGLDFHADPSVAGAAMVYDYGARGRIGFDAHGLVTTVTR